MHQNKQSNNQSNKQTNKIEEKIITFCYCRNPGFKDDLWRWGQWRKCWIKIEHFFRIKAKKIDGKPNKKGLKAV